ncbi:MAG: hypothetical protein GTO18_13190 [Anaerolineales bacterium]|nr:hypothetical protein [Anaerolineales bacterium]
MEPEVDWRRSLLRAFVLFAVYAVLIIELFSFFKAVTMLTLAASWAFALLILVMWLIYRVRSGNRFPRFRIQLPGDWRSLILVAGVVVIIILTALVAWKAPPQTWDSLNYHMSRVAHWAQGKAVRHYATGIEVQNNMPPGAELLVLQTYVLSGGDQLVNFVQWTAMIICLIGVSFIAMQLGTRRYGQLIAIVFAATIPMGIVQASSTMTDYVVALWMVCVASEAIAIWNGKIEVSGIIFISLAAGLAILTKPTAYAYLLPFALLVLWKLLRDSTLKRAAAFGLLVLVLVGVIVAGHFTRNQMLYGNPVGPQDRFDQHASQLLDHRGLISNLVRNISLHVRTPSPYVNKAFAIPVIWLHDALGLDVNDPRTTAAGQFKITYPSTHEILTGNPLHALLIFSSVVAIIVRRRELPRVLIIYTVVILASAILFSFIFKWTIFGSRLQLPFFVLYAPVIGYLLDKPKWTNVGLVIGLVLLLASLPWLVSIDSRPLIPNAERSLVGSVMVEPRLDLLFANGSYLLEPARDVILRIEEAGCTHIGILLSGNGVEYPFWVMLGAPDEDLRIEWLVRGTSSSKFWDPDFTPCAIICEDCSIDSDVFRGLPINHERAPYRLYLETVD